MEVAVMCGVAAGDVQTTTGSNRNLLEKETGLNMTTVGAPKVKQVLEEKIPAVPDRDKWRLAYLGKLLEERGEAHYAGCETGDMTDLIDSLCSS